MAESERFKPHYNAALGKMIHTKDDYLKGIKEHGLIPQKEAKQIAESKRKEAERGYKPSAWAHDMAREIKRSGGKPGSAFYNELSKRGVNPKQINDLKKKAEQVHRDGRGGFHNGDGR